MGDFLTDTIFQDRSGENIITKEEFLKKYETIVNMSDHDLAESMELEPEYASLIVPNMVIIRNFIEIFQAEALWIPGVSLLDGIAYDYAEKNKYLKSVHNFENDILVASRKLPKGIPVERTILQELPMWHWIFLTVQKDPWYGKT